MSTTEMWGRLTPREQAEVQSDLNMWGTGIAIGREPNLEEAIAHYFSCTSNIGVPGVHVVINTFSVSEITSESLAA